MASIQEQLKHLSMFGGRDDFVRFIVGHYRLRDSNMHPIDLVGFEADVRVVVDMILERGVASGREFELRELAAGADIPWGLE